MKILHQIDSYIDDDYLLDHYLSLLYPMSDNAKNHVQSLIDGKSCGILFSGGFRFNYSATYIEPKMYKSLAINWQPNTMFVEPENKNVLQYLLKKLKLQNLLFLNNSIFIKYQSWQQILQHIDEYKNYAEQIIVALPVHRFDYNRLKYSVNDITNLMNGMLIDDTIIVCR